MCSLTRHSVIPVTSRLFDICEPDYEMRSIAASVLIAFAAVNLLPAFAPMLHAMSGPPTKVATVAHHQHSGMAGPHDCCPSVHQQPAIPMPAPPSMPCGDRHRCCFAQTPAAVPDLPLTVGSHDKVTPTSTSPALPVPQLRAQNFRAHAGPRVGSWRDALDVVLRN